MRVIICGDRLWTDRRPIEYIIRCLYDKHPGNLTVIEGNCSGADRISRKVATDLGIPVETYPALWAKYGRKAGPLRNREMIEADVDQVVAFHDNIVRSRGTLSMIRLASQYEVPYWIINKNILSLLNNFAI